jgi:hypothetical protein
MPPSSRARGILRHASAPRRTTVRDAHHGSQMDEPFIKRRRRGACASHRGCRANVGGKVALILGVCAPAGHVVTPFRGLPLALGHEVAARVLRPLPTLGNRWARQVTRAPRGHKPHSQVVMTTLNASHPPGRLAGVRSSGVMGGAAARAPSHCDRAANESRPDSPTKRRHLRESAMLTETDPS